MAWGGGGVEKYCEFTGQWQRYTSTEPEAHKKEQDNKHETQQKQYIQEDTKTPEKIQQ